MNITILSKVYLIDMYNLDRILSVYLIPTQRPPANIAVRQREPQCIDHGIPETC